MLKLVSYNFMCMILLRCECRTWRVFNTVVVITLGGCKIGLCMITLDTVIGLCIVDCHRYDKALRANIEFIGCTI